VAEDVEANATRSQLSGDAFEGLEGAPSMALAAKRFLDLDVIDKSLMRDRAL
jgi:hypothetical protein